MSSYKEGSLWEPTLHGFAYFELNENGRYNKWVLKESAASLDKFLKKLEARKDAKPIPRIIDFKDKTIETNFFNKINTTIIARRPIEGVIDTPTTPIYHDPVTFVKEYVKSYPNSQFVERLVFCTQNPLKNVLVGKKHEFLVGSIIDDEPGLPLHIKLSTLPPPKAETFIPNALNAESSMQQKLDTRSRSGIPFEMAICGNTAEEKKSLLYSVHSFKYQNFRFFYSSEIDAVDQKDTKESLVIPVEVKALHPHSDDISNLYRYKLKEFFVKARLSSIPRIYVGINNLRNPFVYDTIRMYDQQHLGKIPEHCRNNLPDRKFCWTVNQLEKNFEKFSRTLEDHLFLKSSTKKFKYDCSNFCKAGKNNQ